METQKEFLNNIRAYKNSKGTYLYGAANGDFINLYYMLKEYDEFIKSKWIDVYDRLPETEGDYLVCLHNNEVVTVHFYFDEDTNSFNTYGIKYWMPLPEPPSDKSGTAESA